VVLFRRTAKGLELTDEAQAGLEPLRAGFLQFEDAVQAMQAGQSAHVYTIAAPRDFFAAWLAPRLAAFRAANPEVRVMLVDGDRPIWPISIWRSVWPRAGRSGRRGAGRGRRSVRAIAWPGDPGRCVGDAGGDRGGAAMRAGPISPIWARPRCRAGPIGWWRLCRSGDRRRSRRWSPI
jgi:hypothetical protein